MKHWWRKLKMILKKWRNWRNELEVILINTVLPKAINRFNAIPIKITMIFFHQIRTTLKLIWIHKKLLISQTNLKKNEQSWGASFRLYYKATVIKIAEDYTAIFKMDTQQGPIAQHMELCSMLCGILDGDEVRGAWKHGYRQIPLLFTWNYDNFVNPLYSNTK